MAMMDLDLCLWEMKSSSNRRREASSCIFLLIESPVDLLHRQKSLKMSLSWLHYGYFFSSFDEAECVHAISDWIEILPIRLNFPTDAAFVISF